MAQKFLRLDGGSIKELEAVITSAGAGDSGKIVALDATGKLATAMMPTGIAADVKLIEASEDLSAGDFVNIYNDGGTAKCRKADAATKKTAHGFVIASVTSGNNATVYFEGANTQVSGQTPGKVFLSGTTPGVATATAPSTSEYIVQAVGVAVSATDINVELGEPIELA